MPEKKINYQKTLNLPQTSFPLWVNHQKLQEWCLKFWQRYKIYFRIRKLRKGRKQYILHDGPPYANGNIHVGHVLNKVLKDIIVKYKTMNGYDAPYIPGWDCHGLPIEHAVIDKAGLNREKMSALEVRKRCRKYALNYVAIQRKQFEDLGIIGDWENPYLTLDPLYEAQEYEVLKEFVKKGLVFSEKKPVAWCINCQTALAEAEIEYKNHQSPSIYIKFYFVRDPQILSRYKGKKALVAWTTTPWTLPANQALALHPQLTYIAVRLKDEILIIAENLLEKFQRELRLGRIKLLKKFKAQEILEEKVFHPLPQSLLPGESKESIIMLADFVESSEGTGIVHIAPGHGYEDYTYGKKFNLEPKAPVNDKGRFTLEAGEFAGLNVFKANKFIIAALKKEGLLLKSQNITHAYPHCWRCKNPIIFRATQQWFIKTEALRKKALNYVKRVKWIPPEGRLRMEAMLLEKPDWCISRQRKWGVPIPSVICQKCGREILDVKVIEKVKNYVFKRGSEAWFLYRLERFLPAGFRCTSCGGNRFKKGKDILDVWFDSGVSYLSLIKMRPSLPYPSDLYLEGSDQHRGWFQSSLLANIGFWGKAPYKAVLTHGFTVDDKGNKMSKSLGNVVDPLEVQKIFGGEILRLWAASVDYSRDVSISSPRLKKGAAPILEQISEMYFKLRNTLRFLLGNLYDFQPLKEKIPYRKLLEIDRWILAELADCFQKFHQFFAHYEFNKGVALLYNFCTVTLSGIYFDILKDRLYTSGKNSPYRKSAQNALFILLSSLLRMLAPIITFTAEEGWQLNPYLKKLKPSVLLADWPLELKRYKNTALLEKYRLLMTWRAKVNKKLDEARRRKKINTGLKAKVILRVASRKDFQFLKMNKDILPTFFIVSDVEIIEGKRTLVDVKKVPWRKCIRCWKYLPSVGEDKDHPDICLNCLKTIKSR